ncbi:MAG TPA: LacI family DNA-binding transcriptional regulator [Burkholderiaceae bacterium]
MQRHPAAADLDSAPAASKDARPQMSDIARIAGVSVATVSRSLNGSKLINKETRERIVDLARSLNYTINVGAKNLRLKQNQTIAVIVPFDPSTRQHLSDPFFLSLIGSIADALTERGYEMLLSRADVNSLDAATQYVDAGRASGIILIGQWHLHEHLNELAKRSIPFVVWGAKMKAQTYATVGGDNAKGGELATAHLLGLGARRVVFMGDFDLPEIAERHHGYLRAHEKAGVKPSAKLSLKTPFVQLSIATDIENLVASGARFDAIFAASDLMAMTAISALRKLGKRVPDDVLVVGYDDVQLAAFFHPALTTIRQPIEAAGEQLVASLLDQFAGKKPAPRVLRTELILRESTGFA